MKVIHLIKLCGHVDFLICSCCDTFSVRKRKYATSVESCVIQNESSDLVQISFYEEM